MTSPPHQNGYGWRIEHLERRMDYLEQNALKVVVIETKVDTLNANVKSLDGDLRNEIRYLRRVLLGLLVSISIAAIVFGLTQMGQ